MASIANTLKSFNVLFSVFKLLNNCIISSGIKSIVDSRAKTTVKKYVVRFRRFVNWEDTYIEITTTLLCTELHVGLYVQHLMETANHFSSVESLSDSTIQHWKFSTKSNEIWSYNAVCVSVSIIKCISIYQICSISMVQLPTHR
jgi:hypothetical protein